VKLLLGKCGWCRESVGGERGCWCYRGSKDITHRSIGGIWCVGVV
jgi:hypothetical protein